MFSQGKIAESQSESLGLVLKTTAHGPRTGTQYQRTDLILKQLGLFVVTCLVTPWRSSVPLSRPTRKSPSAGGPPRHICQKHVRQMYTDTWGKG